MKTIKCIIRRDRDKAELLRKFYFNAKLIIEFKDYDYEGSDGDGADAFALKM